MRRIESMFWDTMLVCAVILSVAGILLVIYAYMIHIR
jgi:hypothetical protein